MKYIQPLQQQIQLLQQQIMDSKEKALAEERDYYKKMLEKREEEERRAREINEVIAPIQDQISILNQKLNEISRRLTEEPTKPKSEEYEALKDIANGVKEAVEKLGKVSGAGAGAGQQTITDTLDNLVVLIDKMMEVSDKFKGESSEFDWKAAGISTFGEVAKEAIRAYRETLTPPEEMPEETRKTELDKRLIERRVYNYAIKKISEGQLMLNPYEAAEELGLSPGQVWWAVENLKKKGMLTVTPPKKRVKKTVKKEEKVEKVEEGIKEGEISPPPE